MSGISGMRSHAARGPPDCEIVRAIVIVVYDHEEETMDDMTAKLREVIDRQEIHQALMRYCRGVDRADEALVNSAFHPGAIDDHGTPRPAPELAAGVTRPGGQRQLMHFMGNYVVELEGDTAFVESYFISFSPVD